MSETESSIIPRMTDIYKMADIRPELKARMRSLSLGPVAWGAWSWTFHNGSCWASMIFDGPNDTPERLIGWVILTKETDQLPVVGCYIRKDQRKKGYGTAMVTGLLLGLMNVNILSKGDAIFNSLHRWPAYKEIIKSCGLRSLVWE